MRCKYLPDSCRKSKGTAKKAQMVEIFFLLEVITSRCFTVSSVPAATACLYNIHVGMLLTVVNSQRPYNFYTLC